MTFLASARTISQVISLTPRESSLRGFYPQRRQHPLSGFHCHFFRLFLCWTGQTLCACLDRSRRKFRHDPLSITCILLKHHRARSHQSAQREGRRTMLHMNEVVLVVARLLNGVKPRLACSTIQLLGVHHFLWPWYRWLLHKNIACFCTSARYRATMTPIICSSWAVMAAASVFVVVDWRIDCQWTLGSADSYYSRSLS